MTKKFFFFDAPSATSNDNEIKQLLLSLNRIIQNNQLSELLTAIVAKKNIVIDSLILRFYDTSFATADGLIINFNKSEVSQLALIIKSFELLLQELNNKSITHIDSLFYDGLYFYLDLPNKQAIIEENHSIKFVSNVYEKGIRNSDIQTGSLSEYSTHTNYTPFYDLNELATWREYPLSLGYKKFIQGGGGLSWDDTLNVEFDGEGNIETDTAITYQYLEPFGTGNTKINIEKYPAKAFWELWEQLDKEIYQPQQDLFWQLSWDGKDFGLYVNRDRSFYDKLLKGVALK